VIRFTLRLLYPPPMGNQRRWVEFRVKSLSLWVLTALPAM